MSNTERPDTTSMTRTACIAYLQSHGAYSGHSRDSVAQLRVAVADCRDGLQAPQHPLDAPYVPELHPSGPERAAAAKAEYKALQRWTKDGENPPRPATPNLDALNAEHAAGTSATSRRKAAKATGTRGGRGVATGASPEYAAAIATKRDGKRGPGVKVTDTELAAYITGVRKARPEATAAQELEIAYWTAKLALSRSRWMAAWEQVSTAAAA